MAVTKTRYTVTSPITGTVHTRNSTKSHFTHAMVATMRRENGTVWERVSFCGSLALAQKEAQQESKNWPNNIIGANIVALGEV